MAAKRWNELNQAQKTGIIISSIVQLTLLIAALLDLRRRPAEAIRGDKRVWLGVVFINYIGPLAYFFYGRKPDAERESIVEAS